jgi:hypothetical protein
MFWLNPSAGWRRWSRPGPTSVGAMVSTLVVAAACTGGGGVPVAPTRQQIVPLRPESGALVLSGRVSGSSQEPVAGARVVARPLAMIDEEHFSSDMTNDEGLYAVSGLPHAVRVDVTAEGYEPFTCLVQDVATQRVLDVTLLPAGQATTTAVSASGRECCDRTRTTRYSPCRPSRV